MNTLNRQLRQPLLWKSFIVDFSGLALIYLVPTLTHLTSLPIYFIEPMRLMLILAMVHTNRINAYVLTFTLPLFSFIISSHPVFIKVLLISMELALNVYLFFLFRKIIKNVFPAILMSIVMSKLVYYLMKSFTISFGMLNSGLISTPILVQLITAALFSVYVYFMMGRNPQDEGN